MKKLTIILSAIIILFCYQFLTAQCPNEGSIIGWHNGVPAKSNGGNINTKDYQCAEYITRFYQQFLGLKNPDPDKYGWGNAGDFFVNCQKAGFSGFEQGGKIPPLPNEILCFGSNRQAPFGHVVTITETNINGGYIKIIDQNRDCANPYGKLSLKFQNGRYEIGEFIEPHPYGFQVQGWLALPFLYPAGTMIKTASSPKVFVVLNTGKKMWIPNESVFHSHGLSFAKVIEVTEQEMQSYVTYGRSTYWSEPYLHTTFFRASGDYLFKYGSHIYLYDYSQGRKRKIPTYEIMQSWGYDWSDVRSSGKYYASTGSDLWYRDGTVVKARNSSTVYVVENGYKRAFETWELFVAMDYKTENIVLLPDIDINNNIGFRGTRQMINSVNIWKTITSGTFTGKNGKGGGGEINPSLHTSTSSLNFGSSTTTKSFTIKNTGGGTLIGTISDNRNWI
ncbi:CHAP domain-containing protein, partial [Patescibacteria group bacterium]|nr:CHAP domain-containing protein [Patescibacteria group bacterium]